MRPDWIRAPHGWQSGRRRLQSVVPRPRPPRALTARQGSSAAKLNPNAGTVSHSPLSLPLAGEGWERGFLVAHRPRGTGGGLLASPHPTPPPAKGRRWPYADTSASAPYFLATRRRRTWRRRTSRGWRGLVQIDHVPGRVVMQTHVVRIEGPPQCCSNVVLGARRRSDTILCQLF